MLGVPSYYGADDLLLNSLYAEGYKVCTNHAPKTIDCQPDSFSNSSKKTNTKKYVKIGAVVASATALILGACKLIKKFKKP